MNCSKQAQKGK